MPEMAAQGARLIHIHGVGLGYLATVRKDGGPRLHPMCPLLVDGRLWTMIGPHGPKYADLRRDGRYAMHALSPKDVDDEFLVMVEPRRPLTDRCGRRWPTARDGT